MTAGLECAPGELATRWTGGPRGPVVLLHGWSADSRIWTPLMAQFLDQLRMAAPDLPGHGATPLHLDGATLEDFHARSVDAFCEWSERNGLEEAPVCAWAWGASVAIDAVATGRIRPRSMLLVAAAVAKLGPSPYVGPTSRDWPRYVRSIVRMMVADVISPETEQWLAKIMRASSLAAAAGVNMKQWEPPGADFRLPQDTVLVHGGNDRISNGGAELVRRWGCEDVVAVGTAGHTPFIEAKKEFHDVFSAWLNKIEVLG
jgi:pimeloyl-ACP methyl ester carboxylesterase